MSLISPFHSLLCRLLNKLLDLPFSIPEFKFSEAFNPARSMNNSSGSVTSCLSVSSGCT